MGVKPSTHGEPFCRLLSVPAALIGQDRFNHVATKPVEEREKFRWLEKVRGRDVCILLLPAAHFYRLHFVTVAK